MNIVVSEKLYVLIFLQTFIYPLHPFSQTFFKCITYNIYREDFGEKWTKKYNQSESLSHGIFPICCVIQIGPSFLYKLIIGEFHCQLKPNLILGLVSFLLIHFMYWQYKS